MPQYRRWNESNKSRLRIQGDVSVCFVQDNLPYVIMKHDVLWRKATIVACLLNPGVPVGPQRPMFDLCFVGPQRPVLNLSLLVETQPPSWPQYTSRTHASLSNPSVSAGSKRPCRIEVCVLNQSISVGSKRHFRTEAFLWDRSVPEGPNRPCFTAASLPEQSASVRPKRLFQIKTSYDWPQRLVFDCAVQYQTITFQFVCQWEYAETLHILDLISSLDTCIKS